MFESKHEKIAPLHIFAFRFIRNAVVGVILIALSLFFGMWGYSHYENMSLVDAYVNAAMILSGMGPMGELKTEGGKIFAGSYALFSGFVALFFVAVIFTPIFHRFYHQFHLKSEKRNE